MDFLKDINPQLVITQIICFLLILGLLRWKLWGPTFKILEDRRAKIAAEVHRVLSSSTDGHYMGLSAHSIGTDVSSDTYDYFFGLMKRYARYPFDLEGLEREIAAAGQ